MPGPRLLTFLIELIRIFRRELANDIYEDDQSSSCRRSCSCSGKEIFEDPWNSRRMTTSMMINWVRRQSNSNARKVSKPPKSYSRGMESLMVEKVRMGDS